MTLRTKNEQKAYLDGYKMCAKCIENYLSTEDKKKLECMLVAALNAVMTEDTCIPIDVKANIKEKCDNINDIANILQYPYHRAIQELLCEILEIIDNANI